MDLHGNMVGKSNMKPGVAITEMAWNCERFNMEEQTGNDSNNGVAGGGQNLNIFPPSSNNAQPKQPQPYLRPDGKMHFLCDKVVHFYLFFVVPRSTFCHGSLLQKW